MLKIIGSTEYIDIAGTKNIPAKIDTGADSSAIWVSDIEMSKDGVLSFSFFNKKSPLYTGKRMEFTDYMVKIIRSSQGEEQIRYRVELPVTICGENFKTVFTLANRTRNRFAVLIGKRAIKGRFLVDVSKKAVKREEEPILSRKLNQELKEDPYKFHHKYLKKERQ